MTIHAQALHLHWFIISFIYVDCVGGVNRCLWLVCRDSHVPVAATNALSSLRCCRNDVTPTRGHYLLILDGRLRSKLISADPSADLSASRPISHCDEGRFQESNNCWVISGSALVQTGKVWTVFALLPYVSLSPHNRRNRFAAVSRGFV